MNSSGEATHCFNELPDVYIQLLQTGNLLQLWQLFICWDMASWDVSAGQFLMEPAPHGFGMDGDIRDDSYHQSWNAFKSAARKTISGVWASMISMKLGCV